MGNSLLLLPVCYSRCAPWWVCLLCTMVGMPDVQRLLFLMCTTVVFPDVHNSEYPSCPVWVFPPSCSTWVIPAPAQRGLFLLLPARTTVHILLRDVPTTALGRLILIMLLMLESWHLRTAGELLITECSNLRVYQGWKPPRINPVP